MLDIRKKAKDRLDCSLSSLFIVNLAAKSLKCDFIGCFREVFTPCLRMPQLFLVS